LSVREDLRIFFLDGSMSHMYGVLACNIYIDICLFVLYCLPCIYILCVCRDV